METILPLALTLVACSSDNKKNPEPIDIQTNDLKEKIEIVSYYYDSDGDDHIGNETTFQHEKTKCAEGETLGVLYRESSMLNPNSSTSLSCLDDDANPGPGKMWSPISEQQGDDCNDHTRLIHAEAAELCDGLDNNCNGKTDEECPKLDLNIDNPLTQDFFYFKDSAFEGKPASWPILVGERMNSIKRICENDENPCSFGLVLEVMPVITNKESFKDPKIQELIYTWMLPTVKTTISALGPNTRRNMWLDIQSGVPYAQAMDRKKQEAYREKVRGPHEFLFVNYEAGKKADASIRQWEEIDALITPNMTRIEKMKVADDFFNNNPALPLDPHRRIHAWEDRRIIDGDWTKAELIKWMTRVRNDLEGTLKEGL